jgi:hypothetical protein
MEHRTSRRQFLQAVAASGTLAVSSGAQTGTAPGSLQERLRAEVRRRADHHAAERHLVVDYYRIRYKLAYPLPVERIALVQAPVPGFTAGYPWETWMSWALEERVNSLGWAAEWFRNQEYIRTAARDLNALAAWPSYCQHGRLSLVSGHAGRLLWTALTRWNWLDGPLRAKLRAACLRHAAEVAPLSAGFYAGAKTKEDLLKMPAAHEKAHNIPFIGTVGAALAAGPGRSPAAPMLNDTVRAALGTILELRSEGFTEAVAYDGFLLDFAADWLEIIPERQRREFLDHPNLPHYLKESYMLGAPGAIEEVAELGDVEPLQMPFHYSAHAKVAHFDDDPVRSWFLQRWRPERVRANGLGALDRVVHRLRPKAPEPGAMNAHYALVLRTGWEAEDLAVAVSCTNSPAGHLSPPDSGTLVIGARGRWIISDPGYKQYARGEEREYTTGPAAHNYPVINGAVQDKKQPRLLALESSAGDICRTSIELAACYAEKADVTSVIRNVWLKGRDAVIVADYIRGGSIEDVVYHWHGHPGGAWHSQEGWMLLHVKGVDLWFTSPQASLSHGNLNRLPGSRGQLTVVAKANPADGAVWWVFARSEAPPPIDVVAGGREIRTLGHRFRI